MTGCVSCGFQKDRYFICESCHERVCYKCITEGMCIDCYMEMASRHEMLLEEYREKHEVRQ